MWWFVSCLRGACALVVCWGRCSKHNPVVGYVSPTFAPEILFWTEASSLLFMILTCCATKYSCGNASHEWVETLMSPVIPWCVGTVQVQFCGKCRRMLQNARPRKRSGKFKNAPGTSNYLFQCTHTCRIAHFNVLVKHWCLNAHCNPDCGVHDCGVHVLCCLTTWALAWVSLCRCVFGLACCCAAVAVSLQQQHSTRGRTCLKHETIPPTKRLKICVTKKMICKNASVKKSC